MFTIRKGVFETNSSSMHAIVVSRQETNRKYDKPIIFDLNKDFSQRFLLERFAPSDKASYIFHLICGKASQVMPYHNKAQPFTEDEKNAARLYFQRFENFLKKVEEHYKKEGISLSFINYKLYMDEEHGYSYIIGNDGYSSTGCYGHSALVSELYLDSLFDMIIGEQLAEKDINELDEWWCFSSVLDFIINDKSVILQGSDEMTDSEIRKQQKLVLKYVKKSKGDAAVVWPLGG